MTGVQTCALPIFQQFPAALFAGPLGFHEKTFFEAGEERQVLEKAPQVKF